jgi:chromosome segregation ATPase
MSDESDSCLTEAQDESFSSITAGDLNSQQLRTLHSELKKENEGLREELDRAIELGSQVEAAQVKYQKITTELRDVKSERDDLAHRLEISRQTNQELSKKLQDEQRHRAAHTETATSAMTVEIEKVRAQAAKQSEGLYSELDKLRQQQEKAATQYKLLAGRVDRVLQSAQRYFGETVSSLDALNQLLDEGDPPRAAEQKALPTDTEQSERQIRKLKSKVSRARSEKKDLQSELAQYQQELQEVKLSAKQQGIDAERKISQLQDDFSIKNATQNNTILQLEKRIESLKAENTRLRETTQISSESLRPTPGVVDSSIRSRLHAAEADRDRLADELSKVSSQLQKAEAKRDTLSSTLREAQSANSQLQGQLTKLNSEKEGIQVIADEAQGQIASPRSQLHSQPPEPKSLAESTERGHCKKLQKELSLAKREIAKLEQSGTQQKGQIDKLTNDLRALQATKEQLEATLDSAKSQLNELQARLEVKKAVQVDEGFPALAFRNLELDPEIAVSIQKIVGNTSLQPATKIQAGLRAILANYNRKLQELDAAARTLTNDIEALNSKCSQFVIDLSIAVLDKPPSTDGLLQTSFFERIVKAVVEMRQSLDNVKHERDSLKAFASYFGDVFQSAEPTQVTAIDELKQFVMEQHSQLAKRSKELKGLKRENASLTRAFEEGKARLEELTNQTDRISNDLQTTRDTCNSLTVENQRLVRELEAATNALTVVPNQADPSFDGSIHSMLEIGKQIPVLQQSNADLQRALADAKHEQARLRQSNEKQASALRKVQGQLDEASEQRALAISTLTEKFESEKAELTSAHNASFSQLRRELEKQRTDLQQISALLSETQAACDNLRTANQQLSKQNRKLKADISTVKTSATKEKKLAELSAAASRIAAENECTQKFDELKTRTEAEKRRLYGFGAESFKRFFNPLAELDERSFRSVIHQAREELERLSASDQAIRRLVNAAEQQTTEDAVARLVIRT